MTPEEQKQLLKRARRLRRLVRFDEWLFSLLPDHVRALAFFAALEQRVIHARHLVEEIDAKYGPL